MLKLTRSIVLAFLAMLALTSAQAASKHTYYAATFGIILDQNRELTSFRLVQVIDPLDKRKTPVNIQPPQAYVDAARQLVLEKKYRPEIVEGHPKEFFTWFFYVPSQPDRADLDPVHGGTIAR